VADTLREAVNKAYDALKGIEFEDMYYRKDIGMKALLEINDEEVWGVPR